MTNTHTHTHTHTHMYVKILKIVYITLRTIIQKDTFIPVFVATLFTTAKTWKQFKCLSAEAWIKKMWYIPKMEYYSTIKRIK